MSVAQLDDLDRIELPDGFVWRPVRRHFGIRAFGVNAYTAREVGGPVVEEHSESQLGHEEIYLVLRGRALFTVDGNEHELAAGQLVFVRDPLLKRGATALDAETAVLALGGKPGEPRRSARRATRASRASLQPRLHGGTGRAPPRRAAAPAAGGRARGQVARGRA
jgi:hypothetical protein